MQTSGNAAQNIEIPGEGQTLGTSDKVPCRKAGATSKVVGKVAKLDQTEVLGYIIQWRSKPVGEIHSKQFVWAESVSAETGKSFLETYGTEGRPPETDSMGQIVEVVPITTFERYSVTPN